MNRLQYRIVFNKQRGQLMAVAETAVSQTKGGAGESEAPARRALAAAETVVPVSRGPPALIALAAALAMGATITLAPDAFAQVKADPNAPKNQQPTVVNSANGTVQVNIQTPSAAGVSRNTYSQFDVDKRGVILNNARTDASTQLGGYVQGNPWLAKGAARVILNEVNSSAPSQLKGYVEVAGQRAEVIIANPAGIQVDGAGFINASAAVLTTGTPRFNADGSIAGYGVQGGLIRVDGQGLDGSQADYTALLARAVELNAGLWAKDARIQTGTQVMTVEGAAAGQGAGEALAPTGERPRYALDSTALGGIYAQRITLVGTEAGLGVRQAGQVVGGQLTLRADGWLENTGTVYAQEGDAQGAPALTVQSNTGVRNAGWVASRGSADVQAPRLTGEAGSVTAAGMNPDGTLVAGGGSLSMSATQSVAQAGQLLAADRLTVHAPDIDLGGAQAQATSVSIAGGAVAAREALVIATDRLDIAGTAAVDLTRTRAQAAAITASASSLTADGATLQAGQALTLRAEGTLSTRAASLVADQLSVTAHDVDLRQGEWLSLGTGALTVRLAGALQADGARIATNASELLLAADTISAQRARVEHYGAGALTLGTGLLDLGAAQVLTNGDFRIEATQALLDRADLSAPTLAWHAGQLSHREARTRVTGTGASSVVVDGAIDNTQGRIEANSDVLSLRGASIDNNAGVLSTSGNALRVDAGTVTNRAGQILSAGRLEAGRIDGNGAGRLDLLDNTGGRIGAAEIALNAARGLNAAGTVSADGAATLTLGDWNNGDGRVEARALSLTADRLAGAGTVHARGDASIAAGTLETGGTIVAGGALSVRADRMTTAGLLAAGVRDDGTVAGSGDLTIDAAGVLRHGGSLLAGGALRVSSDALALQGSATQAGQVALTARGGALNLDHATLSAAGALAIDAAGQLVTDEARVAGAQVDLRAAAWRNVGGDVVQTSAAGTMSAQVAGQLDNAGGRIGANGRQLTIGAAALDNTRGRIAQAGGALAIDAGRIDGAGGELLAQDALAVRATGAVDLSAALTQARAIDLRVATLSHRGGDMAARDGLTLAAQSIDNDGGRLQAGQVLSLSASTLNNRDGQVNGGTVTIAADTLTNAGRGLVSAAERLTVRANAVDNEGHLQSQGALTLDATGGLANSGTITGLGAVAVTAGQLTQTAAGTIASQADLSVEVVTLQNAGTFAAGLRGDGSTGTAGDLALRATGAMRQGGSLFAAGAVSALGASLDLSGSRTQAAGIALTATAGDLSLAGAQASTPGALSLTASGRLDTTGATLTGADVAVAARQWNNTGGQVAQTGAAGQLTATIADRIDNGLGVIGAQGRALSLQAGELNNAGGRLVQTGGGDLSLRADRLGGAAGEILTEGRLTIAATGAIDLNQATTQASAIALSGASLDHRNGRMLAQGDASLSVTGALRNQSGQVSAAGALGIDAGSLENQAGQLDGRRVTLDAASLNNGAQGLIASRGDLTIRAGEWTNDGAVQSQGRADLTATGTLANTGTIHAQGDAALTAGALTQTATGIVAAQGGLTVTADGIASAGTLAAGLKTDNSLQAGGDLRLDVSGTLQQSGQLLASGALGATAAQLQLDGSKAQATRATLVANGASGQPGAIGLDRATWSIRDALSLTATGAVGSDAAAMEAGSIGMTASSWSNVAGRWLQTAPAGAFTASLGGLLDNRQGGIAANGASLSLMADRLDNGEGRIAQAGGALDVRVRQLDGAQGQLLSAGALTVTATGAVTLDRATTQGGSVHLGAASLSHDGGQLLSAGDAVLRVDGDIGNRGGRMQAAGTLDLASAGLDNTAGQLSAQTLALRAGRVDNGAGGLLGAAGTLSVEAGWLTNAGTVQSVGDATLTVAGAFDNTGMVYSQGRVTLQADQLYNAGTIAAQGAQGVTTGQLGGNGVFAAGLRPDNTLAGSGDLSLSATRSLQFGGTATAAGDLSVAGPSLQLQDAQLQARTMTLRALTGDLALDRAAVAATQSLTMSAGGDLITSRAQVSANTLRLDAQDWLNAGGRVTQLSPAGTLQATLSGDLDNRGGTIESAGAQLTLGANLVDNTSGRIAQAGGNLGLRATQWNGAQGQVLASGALDWQVTGALTATGATTQADSVRIAAGGLAHDGGQLVAAQGATLDIDGTLSNRGGTIAAGAALDVDAATLANTAGGVMQAGGAFQTRVIGTLDNQGGRLRSGGDMQLGAGALDNRGGWAGSDGQLTVSAAGAVQNQSGTLLAQQAVTIGGGSLVNQGGRIASVQGGIGLTTSGLLDNAQGSVLSAAALTVTSTGMVNQGGEMAGTTVTADARGQSFDNRGGRLLSSDAMTVRSGALNNHGGLLQSAGALTVDTAGAALTNTADAAIAAPTGMRAQGALRIDAGSVDNSAGIGGNAVTINAGSLTNRNAISGQTVALGIAGTLDNRGGQIVGAQGATATAAQLLNQGGLIYGAQLVDLRAGGTIDNRDTSGANLGIQGGAVTLRATGIDNRNGQLRADGDLRIAATQFLDNGGGVLSALAQAAIGDGGADPRASTLDLRNGGGKIWGGTGVTASAAGLNGGGEIASGGALNLTLVGGLTNGAGTLLQSRGDLSLTLGGDFINQGVLRANGALSVDARNIDNQASGELSSADTRLTTSGTLSNRGLIDGDRVRIDAGQVLNLGSGRIYGSDLTITGGQLTNGAEGGQSAVIASRGAMAVAMTGAVANTAQSMIYADGDLSLRAGSLLNENATIEASRLLQLDVTGAVRNASVHDGADSLPQDPAAPRVLASKSFISSGGDMRITAGQVVNSGATIEARGDLLLQSADIQNLNPYLKWALVNGETTTGWEFQAPGSTTRYKPEDIRVLWAVTFYNGSWGSEWGSPAQNSLEPFVYEFHPKSKSWSQDTYNRKMLLPSVRYPNEVFGRYLGGLGGDTDGSAYRGFEVKASGDHPYRDCTPDGCTDTTITGAHYPASDRIWSDFGVTPGDDAGLDAALQAFYDDTNSRLRGDFTAFDITRTMQSAKVTQSSAGQIIVGGTLRVEGGGRIVNDMSRVIGRDGVDIQSASVDNRTKEVTVTGTEKTYVYVTWNDGTGVPNTGYDYTTTEVAINRPQKLVLPESGAGGAGTGTTPGGRQLAGAVGGDAGAQAQQASSSGTVNAGATGAVGALNGVSRQAVLGGGAAGAGRATTGWRASGDEALQTLTAQDGTNGAVEAQLRVIDAAEAGARVVQGEDGALVRTGARADRVTAQAVRSQTLQPLDGQGANVGGPGRLTSIGAGAAQVVTGTDANGRLRATPVSLALPGNSLFKLRADTRSGYLVETDPRFANYRDWLSSDFLLQAMQLDPATAQKRLGDGFYEQRLVREQIGKLTGSTFLKGYASDEEMYRALMANGASFAQAHQLRPGVALTAEQMALLTTDLVWLVEQEVTLADGSTQRVLVPQVYLLPRDGDLAGTGALIAGDRVKLALSGTLDNSGDLRASQSLSATAQGIVNTGSVRGTSLALSAKEDLRNLGGELSATQDLSLKAGRDLVIASTTASGTSATSQRTVLDRVASLTAGGVMVLQAGQDVVLDAARLKQTGSDGGVLVDAGRDLKLGTVKTVSSDRATFDAKNFINVSQSADVGSSIQAEGVVILKAGQDLSAKAAQVASEKGAVSLSAGRDVALLAGETTAGLEQQTYHTTKSLFSKTTTSTYDKVDEKGVVATTLSGDSVTVLAKQDIRLQGAQLTAEGKATLDAGRDLLVESAEQSRDSTSMRQSVKQSTGLGKAVGGALVLTGSPLGVSAGAALMGGKSGAQGQSQSVTEAVGSSISAGSVVAHAGRDASLQGATVVADGDVLIRAERNLTLGTSENTQDGSSSASSKKSGFIGSFLQPAVGTVKQSNTSDQHGTTQTGTQVGSLGGSVTLQAGERYTQTGSQVMAQKAADGSGGDIDILAKQVKIDAAQNTADSTQTSKFSKTALGGTVSVPLVSAVQSAIGAAEAGGKTSDKRMQALAGMSAALAAKDAVDAAQTLSKGTGIKVGVSLGTSKSESTTTEQSTTAIGSQVAAQGNVSIRATGGGKDSTLQVVGSDIKADGKATLKADGAVSLEAAQSTSTLHSTNSSSGASIGVSYAFGGTQNGFTLEASANKGKGRAEGTSVTNTQTHVAGNEVRIESGGDTTLKGAVVEGGKVSANVGGNLNIESVQDGATYDAKQQSSGVGVSLCIPPFCYGTSSVNASVSNAKAKGDFTSVTEQSGIAAGDGGFQLTVKGNTDLKGGSITSTQQAVDDKKNSLVTGSLTQSELQNSDSYKASGYSVGVSLSSKVGDQPSTKTEEEKKGDGKSSTKPGFSPGMGSVNGSQGSTTVSGISGAEITITDEAKQKELTGKDAATTVAELNRDVTTGKDASVSLKKSWDGQALMNEVQTQMQITQQALPRIANEIGTEMGNMATRLRAEGKDEEAAKYDEGGAYRVAAHAALGALGGGLAGGVGAGTSAYVTADIAKALKGLPEAVSDLVTAAAATAVGAATGGAAGAATAGNQVVNNYLNHREAAQLEAAREKLQKCKGDSQCQQEAKQEIAALVALDNSRNAALQAACVNPSSAACAKELSGVQGAAQSYAGKPRQVDIFGVIAKEQSEAQTLSEMYGNRARNAGAFNTISAVGDVIAQGVVDGLKLVKTAVLATEPLGPDGMPIDRGVGGEPNPVRQQAQKDLSDLSKGLATFLSAPIDNTEKAIKATLDRADQLEAAGRVDEAQRVRAELYTNGLLVVTGTGSVMVSGGRVIKQLAQGSEAALEAVAKEALMKSGGVVDRSGAPLLDMRQLSTEQKGVMGDLFGQRTVQQIVPDGQKIARTPGVGETGIDDMFKVQRADIDYLLIEYKFVGPDGKTGAQVLGKTNDGLQGSQSWTTGSSRLERAVGEREAGAVRDAIAANRLETWVVTTRPDGSTLVQVLDARGKPKVVDTSKLILPGKSVTGAKP
ncbi:hemagglutinin repeat-containing protein [Mitsuaria sp. GD03876]|uniref:hemagglutinin repeat-containing protein n=1 Tax=Mitsuaria sp. GD03876 TaxID=2975399 RepID=UPI00244A61F9|nr:hemagglutinin repeat-containing protein [Mitsuaria sp. GD03876]MDH0864651.1 hemagglutinin repeat-containing protein [Mitsuaria sp. GD03876]